MTVKWHDRKDVKGLFKEWKADSSAFMLMRVADIYELDDIISWMERNSSGMQFVELPYSSDVDVPKYEPLVDIATLLGGLEKFPSFRQEFDREPSSYSKQTIHQSVAEHAQSDGEMDITTVNQYAYVNASATDDIETLRDGNSRKLTDLFLEDFARFFSRQRMLFLFVFKKGDDSSERSYKGFQDFKPAFKEWFVKFCKNIASRGQVKICIVDQGDSTQLRSLTRGYEKIISEFLRYEDVLEESGSIDFACGVTDPVTKQVKYRDCKRSFDFLEEKRRSAAG